MKWEIYSIKDEKAGAHSSMAFYKSVVELVRSLTVVVNEDKSTLAKFPEDFNVYFHGKFDDETGRLEGCDTPMQAFTVASLKRQKGVQKDG